MNKNAVLVIALAACGPVIAPSALRAQEQGSVQIRLLQDEIRDMPVDHSGLIAASSRVSLELEMPSTDDLALLSDAVVTVIRPDGEVTQVRPDASGLVSINDVEEGPHAVVASSDRAHGAKLFYFKKAERAEGDIPAVSKMSMLNVVSDQLRPLLEEIDDVNGPLVDLEPDLKLGPEFGYRVVLSEQGTIEGDVLTIADRLGGANLKGTRVVVFHRGVKVADTECDEFGRFEASGLNPGIHGLIAAGREGYAAFAFEAVDIDAEVAMQTEQGQYVSTLIAPSNILPVISIPPPMIPEVVQAIEDYIDSERKQAETGDPVGVPIGGFMAPSTPGIGGGGGGGGGGGLGGGGAALAGLAILAAASDDDDDLATPPVASPVAP